MAENKTKTPEQQRINIPVEFMKDVRTEAEFWNRCKALEERYGMKVGGILERAPWRAATNLCDCREDTLALSISKCIRLTTAAVVAASTALNGTKTVTVSAAAKVA
jgi:hypothetical protein